ncbi:MAG: hypothetical protein KDA50_08250 [Rhodobacteraceae bacterium]|nr:hypothetical protein [Paracoccaceae bacterium]
MAIRPLSAAILLMLSAQAGLAETPDADTAPLSAIPWLSETLEKPVPRPEPPAKPLDPASAIQVAPLDSPDRGAAGLFAPNAAGLPGPPWDASNAADVIPLIAGMGALEHPALRDLFRSLVLVEATAPAGDAEAFLLARVDALLKMGDLEAAQALLERAGPDTPALFRRWFDISLLLGTEDRGCATLKAKPDLSPNYETQVFCLARAGRWPTAALTLETATALGRIDPAARDRLARFLDPEIFEGEAPAPLPDPLTPLDFRILEAVGEPIPTGQLPLAFAHSDLRHIIGWKSQIEAAERLARAGNLPSTALLGIYTARRAAASGGVWDRVSLIQKLDIALTARNAGDVAALLPALSQAMHEARLESVLAEMIAPRLSRIELPADVRALAYELALLSNSRAAFAPPPDNADLPPNLAFAASLAQDIPAAEAAPNALASALRAGLSAARVPDRHAGMVAEGRVGEALLLAIRDLADGPGADPADAGDAIGLLAGLGMTDIARQAALQVLLLDPRG